MKEIKLGVCLAQKLWSLLPNSSLSYYLLWIISALVFVNSTSVAVAQTVIPATDGTGTVVDVNGNRFNITGGRLSGDQRNLFHSFQQFNLSTGETANFISNPNINNILTRVVGGASLIDGLLQVTGGNSNLFLMNPAGIIFGRNARLDVPGSFIATTSNQIGFDSQTFFSAQGNNNYVSLVGNPNRFIFDSLQPQAIVNGGNLAVSTGQNIILLGGNVINTGVASAPGGQVIVSPVPGNSFVRISQTGSLLSLEISQEALSRSQSQVPGEMPPPPDQEMPPPDQEMPPPPDQEMPPPDQEMPPPDQEMPPPPDQEMPPPDQEMPPPPDQEMPPPDQEMPMSQTIFPANDGTGTIVNVEGNRFNITGGRLSRDESNLFHSFQQFNLNSGETANFVSNSNINNILARVVEGASFVDGLLEVTGGNSNLFLMNPAGIIFGRNARLDVPGSFIATTSNAIGFNSQALFAADGNNDYGSLVGTPNTFIFDSFQPEAIINAGNLAVSTGQNIILLGGTVISTGELLAPGGQVIVSAVPGDSVVRINQTGNLLSLEISQDGVARNQSQVPGQEPPDGEMPPPDGEMPPPDDGEMPPPDGEMPPPDGEMPPPDGEMPPPDGGEMPPPDGEMPPPDGEMPPPDGEMPPPDGEMPPPDGQMPPPDGEMPPPDGQMPPPPDGEMPPPDGQMPPPPDGEMPPPDGQMPPPDGEMPPPDGEMPPPDGEMPPPVEIPAPLSLAELLTGGEVSNATGVRIGANGQFILTGTGETAAPGDVIVRNITAQRIDIQADNNLMTGNLRAVGGINLTSGERISAGILDTSNPAENAGNIILNSGNNITVNYLNATAGEIGGNILISSGGTFRALGGFLDQNGIFASLSTAGGIEGGSIEIEVNSNTAFVVGNPEINGTEAGITTGAGEGQIIAPTVSFTGLQTQGTEPNQIIINVIGAAIEPESPPMMEEPPMEETETEDEPMVENMEEIAENLGEDIAEVDDDLVSTETDIAVDEEGASTPDDAGGDILGDDTALELDGDGEFGDFEGDEEGDQGQDAQDFGEADESLVSADFGSNFDIDAEGAITELENAQGKEFAKYFGADLSTQATTPANIRQTLTDIYAQTGNESALVYIVALPQQVELVVITSDGSPKRMTVPDVDRTTLLKLVTDFRGELTNPRSRGRDTYKTMARQLHQWLIAPIEPILEAAKVETILFSMDSGLRGLPMAALYDGEQFFVEKYSFSFIPSLSLTDTRYQSLANANVLAMGASDFSGGLNPLPAVPMELSLITESWPGSSFLNQEFTIANLKSQRREQAASIIHLATHGEFKAGAPSNSYIQLWDSQLRLDQLRELGWYEPPTVELLVLSACRTALGDESAELGFAGLAVKAGVKSALASLWYVSDEGTLALMTEFYNELRNSTIKAEALRQAQLALLKGNVRLESGQLRGLGNMASRGEVVLPPALAGIQDTSLSHPYYWSGFMMIGSPW